LCALERYRETQALALLAGEPVRLRIHAVPIDFIA
jgi:hypothetical protein